MIQYLQVKVIYHITKMKDKNHMFLSTGAEALDKIQHPFIIRTPRKVVTERTYLNLIKVINDKTIANTILSGEN